MLNGLLWMEEKQYETEGEDLYILRAEEGCCGLISRWEL